MDFGGKIEEFGVCFCLKVSYCIQNGNEPEGAGLRVLRTRAFEFEGG
jgi:hypothetical protein